MIGVALVLAAACGSDSSQDALQVGPDGGTAPADSAAPETRSTASTNAVGSSIWVVGGLHGTPSLEQWEPTNTAVELTVDGDVLRSLQLPIAAGRHLSSAWVGVLGDVTYFLGEVCNVSVSPYGGCPFIDAMPTLLQVDASELINVIDLPELIPPPTPNSAVPLYNFYVLGTAGESIYVASAIDPQLEQSALPVQSVQLHRINAKSGEVSTVNLPEGRLTAAEALCLAGDTVNGLSYALTGEQPNVTVSDFSVATAAVQDAGPVDWKPATTVAMAGYQNIGVLALACTTSDVYAMAGFFGSNSVIFYVLQDSQPTSDNPVFEITGEVLRWQALPGRLLVTSNTEDRTFLWEHQPGQDWAVRGQAPRQSVVEIVEIDGQLLDIGHRSQPAGTEAQAPIRPFNE